MRLALLAIAVLMTSPALAQFPPPGIFACVGEDGKALGTLSLLVAGDYQWDAGGVSTKGQIASAGDSVEALTGPLGEQHWRGFFATEMGVTTYAFDTDIGKVTCGLPRGD